MPMLNLIKLSKLDVTNLEPQVTWGTNPEMGVSFNTPFPKIKNINDVKNKMADSANGHFIWKDL